MWLGIPKPMMPFPLLGQGAVRTVRSHLGRRPNRSEVPDKKVLGLGLQRGGAKGIQHPVGHHWAPEAHCGKEWWSRKGKEPRGGQNKGRWRGHRAA